MRSRLACDSLVALGSATADGATLFAKNSDREPATECQPLVQEPRRRHGAGATVQCQYVTIPQVEETARLVGSRPYWLWGFEHGLNEHGVAIGNHTVFARDGLEGRGLIGMDLVRLGLERGTSARHAVEVVTTLAAAYGQGGSGYVDKDWPYHSSFLVADRAEAYLVETSDRRWAVRRIHDVGSATNHLSIGTDWDALSPDAAAHATAAGWWPATDARFDFAGAYRDTTMAPPLISSARLARTCALLAESRGHATPAALRAALRDHHAADLATLLARPVDAAERYTVCMHASPVGTTTASMVARLGPPDEPLVSWGSLGSPCLGVFLPYYVAGELPAALARGGAAPAAGSPWWRFHALLAAVLLDPVRRAPRVRAVWDALETEVEARRPAVEAAARAEGPAPLTAFMHANVTAVERRLDALLHELG